jgi:iron complex outermembrane receptor protein
MSSLRRTFFGVLWIYIFFHHALMAGEIQGRVIDASTQKPLSGVNIYFVPERALAATSDEAGKYLIKETKAGSYQLMASYIGYNIQIKQVEVRDAEVATADFAIILSALDIETPIIAASKREQALSEAPTAVSALFAQDVAEADGATTPAEALKQVTGLDYAKVSEGQYNITARGFNSSVNSTMLLQMDGRTLNSVYNNHINWASLPISEQEIDRIEVVKGPGAALYGANAYSGVINIVTKSPRDMKGTTIQAAAGGNGTFAGSYTKAGVNENLAYKISGGFLETDDFTALAPTDNSVRETRQPPGRLRITKGDLRVDYQTATNTQLAFSGGLAEQRNLLFLVGTGRFNIEQARDLYVSGKLKHKSFSLQSYYNGSRTDTVRSLTGGRNIFLNTDLYNIEVQQTVDLGSNHKLVMGGNFRWQRFDSKGRVIPNVESQNLYGLYGQSENRLFSKLNLVLAGRLDYHPTVKFQISPKAALLYRLTNEQSIRLTANQAYINPVFIELFINLPIPRPGFGIRGNQDLDPRKITAFEIGYQGFFLKNCVSVLIIFTTSWKISSVIRCRSICRLCRCNTRFAILANSMRMASIWGCSFSSPKVCA